MFLITYMTGVVKSWVYWPIIAGAVFLYKYKKQKARFEARHPGQVAMAWPLSRQVMRESRIYTATCTIGILHK